MGHLALYLFIALLVVVAGYFAFPNWLCLALGGPALVLGIVVPLLASSTRGFSGAEIEQAVLSAAFEALSERRPLSHQDTLAAIGRTIPMSVTMAEQIKKIESWAFLSSRPRPLFLQAHTPGILVPQ